MGDRERFNLALAALSKAEWQSERSLIDENSLNGLQAFLLAIDMTILPRFLQIRTPGGKVVLTAHVGNRRLLEFVEPGLAHNLKDFNGLIHEGPDKLDASAAQELFRELNEWLGDGAELKLAVHRGITDDHAGGIGLRADRLGQLWDVSLYAAKAKGVADPVSHMLTNRTLARHAWMRFTDLELVQSASPAADRLDGLDAEEVAQLVDEVLSSAAPDQAVEFLTLGAASGSERIVICGAGPDRLFTCLPEAAALDLLAFWDKEIAPGL